VTAGPVGEEGRAEERRAHRGGRRHGADQGSARLVAHLHLPAGWRPAEV